MEAVTPAELVSRDVVDRRGEEVAALGLHLDARTRGSTTADSVVILMTMTTTMSLAEAKAHLSDVVSRVSGQHERVTVTVHGRPSAILIAPEDLESLEETLAILSDADTMRRLSASDVELAGGEEESESDLTAAMRHRGGRPVA